MDTVLVGALLVDVALVGLVLFLTFGLARRMKERNRKLIADIEQMTSDVSKEE